MKTVAIILSGGVGSRLNQDFPKQMYKIGGKPILEHTLEIFNKNKAINSILIVSNKNLIKKTEELISKINCKKTIEIIEGGKTRQDSSYNAIKYLENKNIDYVLFHDAVRPFLDQDIINNIVKAFKTYNAIDTAIPNADTIIKINENENIIEDIPKRKYLFRGQTPQGFKYSLIKKAHELAQKENFKDATDDCGLIQKYNLSKIYVVDGSQENIKVTYPLDLSIADEIFRLKTKNVLKINPSKAKEKLNNTVNIVFGGSSGIGKEVFTLLNSYNTKTYSFSRENGVNIQDIETIKKALEMVKNKEGKINNIIVTAGILNIKRLENDTYESILNQINTNLLGSIYIVKESINYLKKTNGNIILTGSSSANRGRENYSIYSSTKSALINFVQAISEEFSEYNIKINLISPARTNTPLRTANFGVEPKKTLLNPKKVAEKYIAVLCSNYTGQIINIRN